MKDMEKAIGQDREFLASIARALPKDMSVELKQAWISEPDRLQWALKRTLNPPPGKPREFRSKVIRRDGFATLGELCTAIAGRGGIVDKEALKLFTAEGWTDDTSLGSSNVAPLRLVIASNTELGFPAGTTYEKTLGRAEELGLQYCSMIDALFLRYHYRNQPRGEMLHIAHSPVTPEGDRWPHILTVDHDREKEGDYLPTVYNSEIEGGYSGDEIFVFRE